MNDEPSLVREMAHAVFAAKVSCVQGRKRCNGAAGADDGDPSRGSHDFLGSCRYRPIGNRAPLLARLGVAVRVREGKMDNTEGRIAVSNPCIGVRPVAVA